MQVDLDQLDEKELVALNHQVVERIRELRQARADSAMRIFNIGDRVRLILPRDRPQVIGVLTRYNRKTVTVISETGKQWNVDPNYIERLNSDGTVERVTIELRPVPANS